MLKIKLFNLFNFLLKIFSPSISCLINNFRQMIMGRKIVFKYDKDLNLFEVNENNFKIFFSNKIRGMHTYSYGIEHRAVSLAETYSLDLLNYFDDDIIIDCGANYGDIYTWFRSKKIRVKYISFEPSPDDYKCLQLNCKNQTNYQIALSDKIGEFDFYCKSDTGDSSLLEPSEGYSQKIKIKTTTLDEYVDKSNIDKIKLFKVEAEGFEPEVLKGSIKSLSKIEFIAVDGSPERGIEQKTTIEEISNFLINNNFKLVKRRTNGQWIKALFRNSF